MTYKDKVINRIKKEMRDKNFTQKDMAKLLRITETSMSRYLNGQRGLSLSLVIKIADYFDLSLDELVGRK